MLSDCLPPPLWVYGPGWGGKGRWAGRITPHPNPPPQGGRESDGMRGLVYGPNPLSGTGLDASGRFVAGSVASDRGGARTLDQRINVPHRLSPTPRGTSPPEVASLDYPIAVAGVPRLVSEAGTGDPPDPCLLMTQSPAFSDRHVGRRRLALWWRGLSGRPSIRRHPLVAVRFLPARGSSCLSAGSTGPRPRAGKRRSPLLYRLSYPVRVQQARDARPAPGRGGRVPPQSKP
jgi:hypothetical protein